MKIKLILLDVQYHQVVTIWRIRFLVLSTGMWAHQLNRVNNNRWIWHCFFCSEVWPCIKHNTTYSRFKIQVYLTTRCKLVGRSVHKHKRQLKLKRFKSPPVSFKFQNERLLLTCNYKFHYLSRNMSLMSK